MLRPVNEFAMKQEIETVCVFLAVLRLFCDCYYAYIIEEILCLMTNAVSHDFHAVRHISFNIIDFCCIYCSLYIDLHVSYLKTKKSTLPRVR